MADQENLLRAPGVFLGFAFSGCRCCDNPTTEPSERQCEQDATLDMPRDVHCDLRAPVSVQFALSAWFAILEAGPIASVGPKASSSKIYRLFAVSSPSLRKS